MHLTGMTHPSDDNFYSIFIEIAANLSISGGEMQEDIKLLIINDSYSRSKSHQQLNRYNNHTSEAA